MSHGREGSTRTLARLPEAGSWGGAGVLSAVTPCSWPEEFPVSMSGAARRELAHHAQSTRAASAPYTAQSGAPALECRAAGSPMAPTRVEGMIGLL